MSKLLLPRDKKLKSSSTELRNNATKQENHLWHDYMRFYNIRFNRQRVIGEYIVDFYCTKARLVIELDGSQHFEENAVEYDKKRTQYLESLGLMVPRFLNSDIDRNFDGVCRLIDEAILRQAASATRRCRNIFTFSVSPLAFKTCHRHVF